jgi:hypothetical protein
MEEPHYPGLLAYLVSVVVPVRHVFLEVEVVLLFKLVHWVQEGF